MKTIVSGILFGLLLVGVFMAAFNVQSVKAASSETAQPSTHCSMYPCNVGCAADSGSTANNALLNGAANSAGVYSSSAFPISISYQPYTAVGVNTEFTVNVPAGPSAISVGVMNGSATVTVSQSGQALLSQNVTGDTFYDTNWGVLAGLTSYCYVNFNSTGQTLDVVASEIAGQPVVAYNVYDNYISNYTAQLITYQPQFCANFGPPNTPVNTGISFLLVAPTYAQPTPLAIWVGEGFENPQTGQGWWAQIGFNNWAGYMNVSYAGWGIFSNIFGNPGGTDYNYPLTPGDTYNFTMALVSGTTWEFVVNDTLIQEPGLSGLFNTTSTVCNGEAGLGLETLTNWGGNVGITNMISIPMVMSFQVNGQWSEPSSFQFGSMGAAHGVDLWGVAGHLEDSSVPNGALLFNDSLPMILDTPTLGYEPIYGNFSPPQVSSGGGIVTVTKISNVTLQVTPVNDLAYVSIASYETPSTDILSLTDAKITGPTDFNVPAGTTRAVVYAADSLFNDTSSSVVNMVPMTNVTFTEIGLPPGTIWSITLNDTVAYSATDTLTFTQPAGTYSFTVPPIVGWAVTPSSGTVDASTNVNEQISFQSSIVFENLSSDLSNFAWAGALAYQGGSVLIAGDGYGLFNVNTQSYSPLLNRPFTGYSLAAASNGNVILVGGSAYTPPGGATLGLYSNGAFTDATSALPLDWTGGNMGRITAIVAVNSSTFFIMGSTNTTVYAGLYNCQSNTFSSLPQLAANFTVTNGLPLIAAAYASQLNAVMIAQTSPCSLGLFFLNNNTYLNLNLPSDVSSVGYAYNGLTGSHGVASDGSSFFVVGSKNDGSGWEALYSPSGLQDITVMFPDAVFQSAAWDGSCYLLAGRLAENGASASALYSYDPQENASSYMGGIIPSNWYPTQLVPVENLSFAIIGYLPGQNFPNGGEPMFGLASASTLTGSISPTLVTMDAYQSNLFTSAVSGGIAPYSYQWYLNGVAVPGATNATWTFTPTSFTPAMPSYYTVYLNVTDSTGSIVDSNTATVTVNPPLSVHILPTSITTDVDQPQLFTSNVSEGTSPYTYQWYLNDSAVSNATNATWTFTPTSAGDYTVYVNVTDAAGVQATSNTATITVSPVIPEFPSYLILPLFMMITLLAAFALKRERNIRKCAHQDAHGIQHYTNPV